MNKKRMWLVRIAVVLVLIAISACMMVIGRGHTVYFDNKALEYEGKTYDSPYKVTVNVNGEQVAKLYDKERGMAIWIGQNFKCTVEVMQNKGGSEETEVIEIKLPYNMDGIVVNLPGILAGLPQDACLEEFVSNVAEDEGEEAPGSSDEFEMDSEF